MRSIIYVTVVFAYLGLLFTVVQVCASHRGKLCRIRLMWTARWTAHRQSKDPLEPQVRKLMSKTRLHRARLGAANLSYILVVHLVSTLAQMHADPKVFVNDQDAWKAVTERDILTVVASLWAARLSMWFPWTIKSWTLDIFFALLLARMTIKEILVPDFFLRDFYIQWISAQRVVHMYLQGTTRLNVATNITYTICNLCIFQYNFGWNKFYYINQSLALLGVLFMGSIFHNWAYSAARATLEAKMFARSEASVHQVLSAMCDAVVSFGSDCIIRHPCPKLEVLLLRPGTRSALQGTSFTDLLDSCDRDRFDHFLSKVTNESPGHDLAGQEDMACTLHAHMKDVTGTKVPIQIFHGSCPDINEQICHIVGIREDQERPSRMQAEALHTSVDGGLPPLMEHCPMPMKVAASDSSSVSASESVAEVVVWVDIGTPEYTVVRCTPGFSALCGPSVEGAELLGWVSGSERKRFQSWVQKAFNRMYYAGDTNADEIKTQTVLTPPHLKRFKLSVMATVEVAGIEVTGDDEDEASQHMVMQLAFSDLSWTQGVQRRRPRANVERARAAD